jgi:hypothetical protein
VTTDGVAGAVNVSLEVPLTLPYYGVYQLVACQACGTADEVAARQTITVQPTLAISPARGTVGSTF